MIKVEINNREKELESKRLKKFFMVDLTIDGQEVVKCEEPISCYGFWEDLGEAAERAKYRIKKNNPNMGFDFNLATMALSDEEKELRFMNHLKEQNPDVDVESIMEVINKEVGDVKLTGPDDNHPNPMMKMPIDSQMVKAMMLNVVVKCKKKGS